MLGSKVDQRDFIPVETAVALAGRPMDRDLQSMIKSRSPERTLELGPGELKDPFNPPGRLMMLRSDAVSEVGGLMRDSLLYQRLKDAGYRGAITGDVVHRHLSLLHLYDYPEYDLKNRDEFMKRSGRVQNAGD
jgi:hypothetical protein